MCMSVSHVKQTVIYNWTSYTYHDVGGCFVFFCVCVCSQSMFASGFRRNFVGVADAIGASRVNCVVHEQDVIIRIFDNVCLWMVKCVSYFGRFRKVSTSAECIPWSRCLTINLYAYVLVDTYKETMIDSTLYIFKVGLNMLSIIMSHRRFVSCRVHDSLTCYGFVKSWCEWLKAGRVYVYTAA